MRHVRIGGVKHGFYTTSIQNLISKNLEFQILLGIKLIYINNFKIYKYGMKTYQIYLKFKFKYLNAIMLYLFIHIRINWARYVIVPHLYFGHSFMLGSTIFMGIRDGRGLGLGWVFPNPTQKFTYKFPEPNTPLSAQT